MNISFILPTRNNLKYLKLCVESIRKHKGNHDVELCIWDDFSNDGTEDWLKSFEESDGLTLKWMRNGGPKRLGHTILYNKIVEELTSNDLCIIFHADMYLCPGALDAIEKLMHRKIEMYNYEEYEIRPGQKARSIGNRVIRAIKRIVSLTRIEPPLHPSGREKIVKDFGTEPENFDEESLMSALSIPMVKRLDDGPHDYSKYGYFVTEGKTTEGVFAPWAFWKDEFLEIGGHDYLFAPQSKEDSDIWNRFLLNGTKFIQTWEGFVYHFTSRGSRFNPTLTKVGTNSQEWEDQNLRSTRNFIRKWGSMIEHDQFLLPIVPHKYNVGFVVTNCSFILLYNLEIWCDHIQCDLTPEIIDTYIEIEQPNTSYDLSLKINSKNISKLPDIIVKIDGRNLNKYDFTVLTYHSKILTESAEENSEMEVRNLIFYIGKLNHYEKDLIVVKNDTGDLK